MAEPPGVFGAAAVAVASAGELIAVLRDSGELRVLQPAAYGGRSGTVEQFLAVVGGLAGHDGAAGWVAAATGAAAHEIGGAQAELAASVWGPERGALVSGCYQGRGALTGSGAVRRLSGRWQSVIAARYADWLLLPADDAGCRVLVPRSAAQVTPISGPAVVQRAGLGDVSVTDLVVERHHILQPDSGAGISARILLSAGAAVAVVGSADGAWRNHVEQVKERLASSYGGEEIADHAASTIQVARTASDIDAAGLQIIGSVRDVEDLSTAVRAHRQAIARARDAADALLGSSRRHALDESDPVSRLWGDVHAGCRLAVGLFDSLR